MRSARYARGRVASAPARSARASHDAEAWAAFRGKETKETPLNQENLKKYAEAVIPIIKSFGGIPLVRGGSHETFDGDDFIRTVVWEFPNYEKAIECHNSKEYQEGWSLAKDTTTRHMQVIEGFSTE